MQVIYFLRGGCVGCGGCVGSFDSVTVTVNVQDARLLLASAAVAVTEVIPIGNDPRDWNHV